MENITLKQLLRSSDLEEVYKILHQKHDDPYGLKIYELEDDSFELLRAKYGEVCLKLLTSDEVENNTDYVINMEKHFDISDGSSFIHTYLSIDDQNISLTELSWGAILNIPIKIHKNLSNISDEEIVANILFELTFWGWSEEEIESFFRSIDEVKYI